MTDAKARSWNRKWALLEKTACTSTKQFDAICLLFNDDKIASKSEKIRRPRKKFKNDETLKPTTVSSENDINSSNLNDALAVINGDSSSGNCKIKCKKIGLCLSGNLSSESDKNGCLRNENCINESKLKAADSSAHLFKSPFGKKRKADKNGKKVSNRKLLMTDSAGKCIAENNSETNTASKNHIVEIGEHSQASENRNSCIVDSGSKVTQTQKSDVASCLKSLNYITETPSAKNGKSSSRKRPFAESFTRISRKRLSMKCNDSKTTGNKSKHVSKSSNVLTDCDKNIMDSVNGLCPGKNTVSPDHKKPQENVHILEENRKKLSLKHKNGILNEHVFEINSESFKPDGIPEPTDAIDNDGNARKKRQKLSRKRLKRVRNKKLLKEAMNLNAEFNSIHLTPNEQQPPQSQATPSRSCTTLVNTKSPNVHLDFSPISNSQGSINELRKEVGGILGTLHVSSPEDPKPKTVEDISASESSSIIPLDGVLKDVVAYVQVRSDWEDQSLAVEEQLTLMGARVLHSKKLKKSVTHLVFKDGQRGLYKKAFCQGIHIVPVHWVESCKQHRKHMPEHLFQTKPPPETPTFDIFQKSRAKRFRAMQPKDLSADLNESVEKVKEIVQRTLELTRSDTLPDRLPSDENRLVTAEKSKTVPDVITRDSSSPVKRKRLNKTEGTHKKSKKATIANGAANLLKTLPRDALLVSPSKKGSKLTVPVPNMCPTATKSIVMTSTQVRDQEAVYSIVESLGGFNVCDSVESSTTHVICGDKRRTLNLLKALVIGCWVLSPRWIYDSLESGRWLDEEPYEIDDFFPAVKISRMERATHGPSYRQNLFGGVGNIYIAPMTKPPPDQLRELIEMAGGNVVTSMRNSEIIIGPENTSWAKRFHHIQEHHVLDCITKNEALTIPQH